MEEFNIPRYRSKYKLAKPTFTTVLHPVREKLGLSWIEYGVFDSIHHLSHSERQYPYCTMSKKHLAKFLGVSERFIYKTIKKGEAKQIIERNERGDLRTTAHWTDLVYLYSPKSKAQDPHL